MSVLTVTLTLKIRKQSSQDTPAQDASPYQVELQKVQPFRQLSRHPNINWKQTEVHLYQLSNLHLMVLLSYMLTQAPGKGFSKQQHTLKLHYIPWCMPGIKRRKAMTMVTLYLSTWSWSTGLVVFSLAACLTPSICNPVFNATMAPVTSRLKVHRFCNRPSWRSMLHTIHTRC